MFYGENVAFKVCSENGKLLVTFLVKALIDTGTLRKKENPSSPNKSRTYELPITSLDALPLSYRRLVQAKAIKGSWDKHPGC